MVALSCTPLWSLQKPQLILQQSGVRTTLSTVKWEQESQTFVYSQQAAVIDICPREEPSPQGGFLLKFSDLSAAMAPSSPGSDGALNGTCLYSLQVLTLVQEWGSRRGP